MYDNFSYINIFIKRRGRVFLSMVEAGGFIPSNKLLFFGFNYRDPIDPYFKNTDALLDNLELGSSDQVVDKTVLKVVNKILINYGLSPVDSVDYKNLNDIRTETIDKPMTHTERAEESKRKSFLIKSLMEEDLYRKAYCLLMGSTEDYIMFGT